MIQMFINLISNLNIGFLLFDDESEKSSLK
jgi:hypothetical protein